MSLLVAKPLFGTEETDLSAYQFLSNPSNLKTTSSADLKRLFEFLITSDLSTFDRSEIRKENPTTRRPLGRLTPGRKNTEIMRVDYRIYLPLGDKRFYQSRFFRSSIDKSLDRALNRRRHIHIVSAVSILNELLTRSDDLSLQIRQEISFISDQTLLRYATTEKPVGEDWVKLAQTIERLRLETLSANGLAFKSILSLNGYQRAMALLLDLKAKFAQDSIELLELVDQEQGLEESRHRTFDRNQYGASIIAAIKNVKAGDTAWTSKGRRLFSAAKVLARLRTIYLGNIRFFGDPLQISAKHPEEQSRLIFAALFAPEKTSSHPLLNPGAVVTAEQIIQVSSILSTNLRTLGVRCDLILRSIAHPANAGERRLH